MIVTDHPAVAAYLARLDAVAAHLPADRRSELRADLVEHLADALPAGADDAAVRAALERLGPPEEIVHAEQPGTPKAPAPAGGGATREALAVLMLTVGSFVPLVGWLVGAVLLWRSPRWTDGEKTVGTLVVPGGPFAALLLGLVPTETCSRSGPGGSEEYSGWSCPWRGPSSLDYALLGLRVVLVVAPFVVGAVLYRRAATRASATTGRAAPAASA